MPNNKMNVAERLHAHFEALDLDNDHALSAAELGRALASNRFRGADAAAVAALRSRQEEIATLHPDPAAPHDNTHPDHDAREHEAPRHHHGGPLDRLDAVFRSYAARIDHRPREVFVGSPSFYAAEQGYVGNCGFIAAVGATLADHPDAFSRLIEDHADGSYSVHFPGRAPTRVLAPSDGELSVYASAGPNGLWLSILEKAYGKLVSEENGLTELPLQEATRAQPMTHVIEALTGREAKRVDLDTVSRDVLRGLLRAADKDQRIVVAAVSEEPDPSRPKGLIDNHAYSVLGYDGRRDEVLLRNPWGSAELEAAHGGPVDGVDDGVFRMTLPRFASAFTALAYEQAE